MIDVKIDIGKRITENTPPVGRIEVSNFLKKLFPRRKVEYTSRDSMVRLAKYSGFNSTSSLFFQTAYSAFSYHYALGLRPEVLMYLIVTVVAETVRRYPEDYRDLFTCQTSKVDVRVRNDSLRIGYPNSPWGNTIKLFDRELRSHISTGVIDYMLPDFTTSSKESSVASLIAFMDAVSVYYDYHVYTLCGIPRVVLFGEAIDYRRLVTSVTKLAEIFQKHLSVYFDNLIPVLETLAKTAEGSRPDTEFWSRIYKRWDDSGTNYFSGWLSAFLWYVHEVNIETGTNPLVVKSRKLVDWRRISSGDGLAIGSEPLHLSQVPFTWHYCNEVISMYMVSGVLGIENEKNTLTPRLGYSILHHSD